MRLTRYPPQPALRRENCATGRNNQIAANILSDNSVAYANAEQDVTIDQSNP